VSRDRAVGGIGKPPFPQRRQRPVRPRPRITEQKKPIQQYALDFPPRYGGRLRAGDHPRPATGQCNSKPLVRSACGGQRMLLQVAAGGYELIPLRAGKLAACRGKPRFQEVCDGEVDIVAAQQDMLAHRHAPDVRDRALLVQAQFEKAEIRGAAADVDYQHVTQPSITIVEPLPQLMRSRVVRFQPAIKCSLRLLEQSHFIREARFLGGGHR
jgi:hypothetical protein